MGDRTGIEWTDATWNPVTGCTRVSEGCKNCYAYTLHDMRHKAYHEGKAVPGQYAKPFGTIQTFSDRLSQPLRWQRPRKVFVNSLSDLFHDQVEPEFIGKVFEVMSMARRHTFQILTKRPHRMLALLQDEKFQESVGAGEWPLSNVWLGVSVENQRAADERIPLLCETPAAVRFLSCEPLLGPVDIRWMASQIDWVIVGGESGSASSRPMQPEWVRSLRDQCQTASVAFFFKQWGDWAPVGDGMARVGKKKAGRLLDGVEWNQYPGGDRDD